MVHTSEDACIAFRVGMDGFGINRNVAISMGVPSSTTCPLRTFLIIPSIGHCRTMREQPNYSIVRDRTEHREEMAKVFKLAFQYEERPDHKLTTEICKSLYWAKSLDHIFVLRAEDTHMIAAWFSIRERSPQPKVSATNAKDYEPWYVYS